MQSCQLAQNVINFITPIYSDLKMQTPGRKTPSHYGSQRSVYSTGSTLRTLTKSGPGSRKSKSMASLPWYRKPLVHTAFYTDLQRGSWHFGFYSFVSRHLLGFIRPFLSNNKITPV